jgi:hypothetical protein
MTSCGCLLREKVEDRGGEAVAPRAGGGSCAGMWSSRSEAIFPIYVMRSSRPSTVAAARSIVDSAGDPIWDAVKSESKSEVSVIPNPALAPGLKHCLRCLDSITVRVCLCDTQMVNYLPLVLITFNF